ncbi:hypothetical protein AHF37_09232 [Paragonimus kellicotti]|nr:hypothetical protein AHF37_09232 [Paragonimus kellicotti]
MHPTAHISSPPDVTAKPAGLLVTSTTFVEQGGYSRYVVPGIDRPAGCFLSIPEPKSSSFYHSQVTNSNLASTSYEPQMRVLSKLMEAVHPHSTIDLGDFPKRYFGADFLVFFNLPVDAQKRKLIDNTTACKANCIQSTVTFIGI